jgi:hypothetical protein
MNEHIDELLRDGMERFTAGVQAPAGLARTAGRLRRRRTGVRAAAACGTAAVTAAAVIAVAAGASGAPARSTANGVQARTAAYVVRRVENALAGERLVFRGRTVSTGGPSVTWGYGPRNRYEEFFHGRRYLAEGTALRDGKLTGAYVTYFDRKFSLSQLTAPAKSACSTTNALGMGGPPVVTNHWSAFISATLACGAANVTGHVRIDGVETTRITGTPVTVRLSPGYAKAVHEKQARVEWTLYVNPTTYLPVRMVGSTETFGGPARSTRFASVTDVQWLRPTRANIDATLVTIPAGFHQVSSPARQ